MQKPKIMVWSDYACSTGFGQVASNIWQRLYKTGKYDLDVVGINYSGDPYDRERFPGNVYTAMSALNLTPPYNEPYGRQKLLDILGESEYDLVWFLQDSFIYQTIATQIKELQENLPKPFRSIFYYPIDAPPKEGWIKESVSMVDYPVVYTNYGFDETIKIDPSLNNKLSVIYHGHNFDEIYYQKDRDIVRQFRQSALRGLTDGKFLILNVNRNQRRKDIARSLMVLKEIKDRGHDDVIMYLHMASNDIGGNIIDMATQLGLELEKDYLVPDQFNVNTGYPVNILNLIYNCADVYFTTTHGEGWGLGVTEAMAVKCPVVAPNNTSLTEILDKNRGFLVDSGANASMWIMKEQDNERLRPLVDVDHAADKLLDVKNGILPDIEGAYQWVNNLDWNRIAKQWETFIDKALITPIKPKAFSGMNREQRRKLAKQK